MFIDIEKAAYAALEASDGEYEELEDDFLMTANEGQIALEVVEEEEVGAKPDKPFDMNEEDFRTRDIMILEDEEEDEEEKALKEYRERMAALLPEGG